MNKLTKGIIGVASVAVIATVTYFGFYSTDDYVKDVEQTMIEKTFYSHLDGYENTGKMPDINDATITFGSPRDFNAWSWQKFLHYTEDVKLSDSIVLPRFMTDMYQVADDGLPVTFKDINQFIKNGFKYLDNTINNNSNLIVRAHNQAYRGYEIFSGKGAEESNLVYYSIHINNIMKKDLDKYNSSDNLRENPDTRFFSTGALEFKIAWAKVSSLDPNIASKCIKLKAQILNDDLSIKDDSVELAMIGIHVVGVAKGHPGFIWSTFEHDALAYNKVKQEGDNYIVKEGEPTILDHNATLPKRVEDRTNYYIREIPYGVDDDVEYKASIIKINNDVKEKGKNYINSNYFLNGSIWIKSEYDDNAKESARLMSLPKDKNINTTEFSTGSMLCANVSMETNAQKMNCFTCHSTNAPRNHGEINYRSMLNFSHLHNNRRVMTKQLIQYTKDQLNKNKAGVHSEENKNIPGNIYSQIYENMKKEIGRAHV